VPDGRGLARPRNEELMNPIIFVTYQKRRPQYLAVCQCGARHGPYLKVALIPPQCQDCEKALVKERKVSVV
jgi:hypothetical protein